MTSSATRIRLGSLATYRLGVDTYDPDKLGLGKNIFQYAGAGEAAFAGPAPIGVARPMEQATAIASQYPQVIEWQNNAAGEIDRVFLADLSTAGATRRINCYEYNRRTSTFTWVGFVTVTFPGTSEAKTIRALRMTYDKHTAGTASASGTAVTGTSTTWQTDGACVGNRIGRPTTPGNASTVPVWYEISAIGSDTSITLTASAGTISGSNYIIEDLRACIGVTTITTNLGGLYICKGLNFDQFSSLGGTVPAVTTVDNIRACYFIRDAVTGTALAMFGFVIEATGTFATRHLYLMHTIANPIVFKFNIRAPLTVLAGSTTSGFLFKTGSGGAVTGTTPQLQNVALATMASGPASGVEALYFVTTTRVYCAPTAGITDSSTVWLSSGYVMTEVPPGGVNTIAASAAMNGLDYVISIDKWLILTTGVFRDYCTQFRADAGQLDRTWGINNLQLDQTLADSNLTPIPTKAGAYSTDSINRMTYLATAGTTVASNRLYAIPFGVDREYRTATANRLIFPKMVTTGASTFIKAFMDHADMLGGKTDATKQLGQNCESCFLEYRTSGISDNSGAWTELNDTHDIGTAGANEIQFCVTFRTIGHNLVMPRVYGAGVIYDVGNQSAYWQGSSNIGTDLVNKRFGFRHAVAYGGTVPRLKITLYDAESGSNLGSDDTTTAAWTWEKSTNAGGAWGAMNQTDRANADTYIRVTPTSLADNIKVRAVLSEY